MAWFKYLIALTVALLIYKNADAHFRSTDTKHSTDSYLNINNIDHDHDGQGNNIVAKTVNKITKPIQKKPKTKEQVDKEITIELKNQGLIDNKKAAFKSSVKVPDRSKLVLERAKRKKAKFKSMLRREYLKLAERLTLHKNWTDATHFRRKAYNAGKTEKDILPEDPDKWVLDDDYLLSELYDARIKLIDGLNASSVFLVPNAAAKSIVYYDCWLEQTQNIWKNDPTDCKQSFFEVFKYLSQAREELRMKTVIDILENYPLVDVEEKFFPYKNMRDNDPYEGDYATEMKETVKKALLVAEEKAKADALKAQKALEEESLKNDKDTGFIIDETANDNPEIIFVSYFSEKSFEMDNNAKNEVDKAITEIKNINPELIIINGHTDRAVSSNEALILSKKRADVVRDYLVSKGIPAAQIRSFGFGNTDNLVPNPEGESVAGNRRVEIIFRAPNL